MALIFHSSEALGTAGGPESLFSSPELLTLTPSEILFLDLILSHRH